MKILVTGAKGFVGKNLCQELKNQNQEVMEIDASNTEEELVQFCSQADFVFHLAGVNRPKTEEEFAKGNTDFTAHLCEVLKQQKSKAKIAFSSSIQAVLGNAYGNSKTGGEQALFDYEKETGNKVYVFRFPNIFGKWCRPNYNSMVATFCNNIANGLEITVNDENAMVPLLYIDDLVGCLIGMLDGKEPEVLSSENLKEWAPKADPDLIEASLKEHTYYTAGPVYKESVGGVAKLLYSFKASRENLMVPDMTEGSFEKKLYSTYLSYLPEDEFGYDIKMNVDARGSFTELLKSPDRGQVSVNIAKPGITKGNHWHHSKNEKFIVVSGKAMIRFRKLDSDEVIEVEADGEHIKVVDIPPGYTHNISNIGDCDLVTVMWANEPFDPENPDTYYLEV
ncbi:MAG: NAD-dependent epimerase/dehydratase family protein [Lachnospiraceae bacterium]|nr:NAD-dependent epimerase/dehydratase family protein [Lachnospiraceae bacterium]